MFSLLFRGCSYLQLVLGSIVFHFYMPNMTVQTCILGVYNLQVWTIHLRWRAKSIGRTALYFGRVQSIRMDNVSLKCHPHSCRIYEWRWTKRRDGLKSEFLHLFVKSPIKIGFALGRSFKYLQRRWQANILFYPLGW